MCLFEVVAGGVREVLLDTEIPFGGLNRRMPQADLNLLETLPPAQGLQRGTAHGIPRFLFLEVFKESLEIVITRGGMLRPERMQILDDFIPRARQIP
jgi:hypothetical protein